LLSRISWSTDNSCSMSYRGDIHRGVWAGDRFDITTVDQVELGSRIQWKDVSREVEYEITVIWFREYGDDWLQQKVILRNPLP